MPGVVEEEEVLHGAHAATLQTNRWNERRQQERQGAVNKPHFKRPGVVVLTGPLNVVPCHNTSSVAVPINMSVARCRKGDVSSVLNGYLDGKARPEAPRTS
jgi:hypothetical protein